MFLNKKEYADLSEQMSSMAMSFILVITPIILIVAFLFTLFRTVLKYYDLHFKETNQGYRLISGLFTRNEKQANFQKIQLVGWHTNPIKKLFGMFELNLSQIVSCDTFSWNFKMDFPRILLVLACIICCIDSCCGVYLCYLEKMGCQNWTQWNINRGRIYPDNLHLTQMGKNSRP